MNIFENLLQDHEKQRALLNELVETHGDTQKRDDIFKELCVELKAHAIVEEKYYYVPLINDGRLQDKARHSVAEHHEIDELLERLEKDDYSSPGWLVTAKQLREKVFHHLDEEEREVFPISRKAISGVFSEELGNKFEQKKTSYVDSHIGH